MSTLFSLGNTSSLTIVQLGTDRARYAGDIAIPANTLVTKVVSSPEIGQKKAYTTLSVEGLRTLGSGDKECCSCNQGGRIGLHPKSNSLLEVEMLYPTF